MRAVLPWCRAGANGYYIVRPALPPSAKTSKNDKQRERQIIPRYEAIYIRCVQTMSGNKLSKHSVSIPTRYDVDADHMSSVIAVFGTVIGRVLSASRAVCQYVVV